MLKLPFARVAAQARAHSILGWLGHPSVPWVLFAGGGILLAVGWPSRDAGALAIGAVFLFAACLARVLAAIRVGFVALAVLLTFALFLMSRLLTSVVFRYPSGAASGFGMPFKSEHVDAHVFLSLGLALVGVFLSLPLLSFLNRQDQILVPSKKAPTEFVLAARRASLGAFWVALPFQFALDVEAALFVAKNGYLSYYIDFYTAFPEVLRILGGAFQVAFLAYLATNPPKKSIAIPTIAYLLEAVVSVASGQRTEFFLSTAIVVLYFAYRHLVDDPTGRWITARMKVGAALVLPAMVALAGAVAQLRTTYPPRGTGPLAPILNILYAQGVSIEAIGYGYVYRAQIPHDHLYTLGPILNLLQRHLPGIVGLGPGVLTEHTIERATSGGYYSHMISYLVLGDGYLKGSGIGSSFVAELWADFSYPGVLIGSFVIGLVIFALTAGLRHSWSVRVLSLLLIREILLIPRQGPTQFIVEAGTLSTVVGAVVIVAIALVMIRRFRAGPSSWVSKIPWPKKRSKTRDSLEL